MRGQRVIDGRSYRMVDDGSHIHVDRLALGTRPLLADEHAARGTQQRADDRDRPVRPDPALSAAARSPASARGRRPSPVQGGVDERVGVCVLSTGHGADRPALELAERAPSPAGERAHGLMLDLVDAVDLLGDQLGVAYDTRPRPRPARVRSRSPSSSARYSATLFVAAPSSCACSPITSPRGS